MSKVDVDEIDEAKIAALFPRASKSFIKANPQLCPKKPERDIRPTVVDAPPGETKGNERTRVSIVMFRVRLLDTDNAYGSTKPLVDCLRTCGLISGDSEKEIDLSVTQQKVDHFADEKTEVRIAYP